jgi:nitroreductase
MTTAMDAITALTTRASNGKLGEPAPDAETLRLCFEAAACAPDHGTLRPLRVRVVRGAAREHLGELMAETAQRNDPSASEEELAKVRGKALRAPLILVLGAHVQSHAQVPAVEQVLAAGAAAQSILLTLHARGYAAIWRTGASAYDERVKRALGFTPQDAIVGFIYAGTAKQPAKAPKRPLPEDFVSEWSSESELSAG